MTKYAAFGTLLKKGDAASPEVFTAIAGVRNIGGAEMTLEALDVSDHSSEDGNKEFVGGLIDNGEVSFEMNMDLGDETQDPATGVIFELNDRSLKNYQILYPDGSTATFAALMTAVSPQNPHEAASLMNGTLKISGVITWA